MRYELRLHRLLLKMLAVLLLVVIVIFIYLTPHFVDPHAEAAESLIVVLVVATILVYMGAAEGVVATQFGLKHKREMASYLLLGVLSLVSGIYLAISDRVSLQTVAIVVSPHAFLFGVAQLRLTSHVRHHRELRKALLACGLVELGSGLALLAGWRLSVGQVAVLLGYVASLTTLQLLSILFYPDILKKTSHSRTSIL